MERKEQQKQADAQFKFQSRCRDLVDGKRSHRLGIQTAHQSFSPVAGI